MHETSCGPAELPGAYETKMFAMHVKLSSPSNSENTLTSNARVNMLSYRLEMEEMLLVLQDTKDLKFYFPIPSIFP